MTKYRKKPGVIDAVQLIEGNDEAIMDFMNRTRCPFIIIKEYTMTIRTLEGEMTARQGDWIICGISGEFSACPPDIFEAMYEPVVKEEPTPTD